MTELKNPKIWVNQKSSKGPTKDTVIPPSINSLLDSKESIPYIKVMKATLTSKGQVTIPLSIRTKLGLKPGQVLDFDETTPYLRATAVFDDAEMRSVLGCAKGKLGVDSSTWLGKTRGPSLD